MKPSDLVQKAVEKSGATSDYQLAKQIGVPKQYVSRWRANTTWPDNDHTALLAEVAGLDVWETICALEYERHEDEAKRSRWAGFLAAARTKAGAFAAVMLAALATAGHPLDNAGNVCSPPLRVCRIICVM